MLHADPPVEHKAYLHRSGRTARAGAEGTVVTMMLDAQVRDVRDLTRKAGIEPTITKVVPGHPLLQQIAPGERTLVPVSAAMTAAADAIGSGERRGGGGGGRSGGGRSSAPRSNGSNAGRSGGGRSGSSRGGSGSTGGQSSSRSGGSSSRGFVGRTRHPRCHDHRLLGRVAQRRELLQPQPRTLIHS